MKKYKIFAPETNPFKFRGKENEVFEENVFDMLAGEQFRAKIMVSESPQEGYEETEIQIRGDFLPGDWHIKVVEKEEEPDTEVVIHRPAKFSERRGYMLRSMMEEEKQRRKEEIMTEVVEERENKSPYVLLCIAG